MQCLKNGERFVLVFFWLLIIGKILTHCFGDNTHLVDLSRITESSLIEIHC